MDILFPFATENDFASTMYKFISLISVLLFSFAAISLPFRSQYPPTNCLHHECSLNVDHTTPLAVARSPGDSMTYTQAAQYSEKHEAPRDDVHCNTTVDLGLSITSVFSLLWYIMYLPNAGKGQMK